VLDFWGLLWVGGFLFKVSMFRNYKEKVGMFKDSKEVLEYVKGFMDEDSGYINGDLNVPLESQGNILEKTGQVLVGLGRLRGRVKDRKVVELVDEMIEKIIDGLWKNFVVGLVPRTLSNGESAPKERKSGLWEKFGGVWRRTDVSHSQFSFLYVGLLVVEGSSKRARKLREELRYRLVEDGYKIMKLNGREVVDNGRFYNVGTVGLKKLIIMGGKEAGLLLKVNYWIMKVLVRLPWHSNEKFNMLFFLWAVSGKERYMDSLNKMPFMVGPKELDSKAVLAYSHI